MKNKLRKSAILGLISSLSLASVSAQDTKTNNRWSDNFNDNNIDPFEVCTTQSPNTVQVVSKRVKTTWKESGYNGRRGTRGVEACAELQITGKGRFEYKFELPGIGSGSNGKPRYPANKDAGIGQIFQNGDRCNGSWALMIKVINNNLYIDHRGGCGASTLRLITRNIERNKMHTLRIDFDPSRNKTGFVKAWFNGKESFSDTGINFGFATDGQWRGDNLANGAYLTGKFGQYNYDTGDYGNNEIRTVYYDNVTWMKR